MSSFSQDLLEIFHDGVRVAGPIRLTTHISTVGFGGLHYLEVTYYGMPAQLGRLNEMDGELDLCTVQIMHPDGSVWKCQNARICQFFWGPTYGIEVALGEYQVTASWLYRPRKCSCLDWHQYGF